MASRLSVARFGIYVRRAVTDRNRRLRSAARNLSLVIHPWGGGSFAAVRSLRTARASSHRCLVLSRRSPRMIKQFASVGLAAVLSLVVASPGIAALSSPGSEATVEAERLLGSAHEAEQAQAYLPFTRQFSADGLVTGSLAQSAASAGVPLAAMLEALRAIGTAIDLERDLQDGDSIAASGTPAEAADW